MQFVLPFQGSLPDSTLTETTSQREAITSWRRGNICVLAGPGSGKTRVLVERFRWLVDHKGLDPRSILAVTFTKKAAQQMLERLVSNETDSAKRQAFQQAPISTIHVFCAGLLREHAFEAGLDPEFSVMEDWEGLLERRRIIREVLEQAFTDDPVATEEFLRAFAAPDVAAEIEGIHESMRSCGGTASFNQVDVETEHQRLVRELADVSQRFGLSELRDCAGRFAALETPFGRRHLQGLDELESVLESSARTGPAQKVLKALREKAVARCRLALVAACYQEPREWLTRALAEVERRYAEWKQAASKLDFADLEIYTVQLLKERPDLCSRFMHVLVDEYQDTNGIQSELITLLRPRRTGEKQALFAVGDINQSIYGFRHADPGVFRRYREEIEAQGGHIVELRENFRSRPEILRAAEIIFVGQEGVEPRSLVAASAFAAKKIPSVEVLVVRHGVKHDVRQQEALHVAARITQLRAELRIGDKNPRLPKWGDFAVLLRTRKLIEEFSSAFREAGIPYQLSAGQGFFDAPEIRDITHFLRVIANPRDEISLASVLRSPFVGVSDETLLVLKKDGANLADALAADCELEVGEKQKLELFRDRLGRFRRARETGSPDLLVNRLMAETGYQAYVASRPGAAHQLANIRKFLELLRRVYRASDLTFDQLVRRIEDLRASESPEAEAGVHDEESDAVQLMTLHGAKGLEFPVIFLPALQSGAGGRSKKSGYDPDSGAGACWKDPLTGESIDDPALAEIRNRREQREKEESNRLLYVAMTRAQEHLVLSASFGPNVRVTNWAKLLRDKLRIDVREIDASPKEEQCQDLRFRLFRTDQPPEILEAQEAEAATAEPAWIDPLGRPADQADSAAAVTSVALFAHCPRRYYLSRYLGFEQLHDARPANGPEAISVERDEQMDATEFGRRVHSALAGSLQAGPDDQGVIELVQRFRESDLGKRVPPDAHHEENLLFSVDGHLLQGQLDLWFEEGGEITLVDYKTDQVKAEEVPERARDYELQLQLYAHAIEQAAGRRPNRAVLYFLRPNVPSDVDLSPSALEAAKTQVAEFFTAQSEVQFPLNIGQHCFRCPHYRQLCPAKIAEQTAARSRAGQSAG